MTYFFPSFGIRISASAPLSSTPLAEPVAPAPASAAHTFWVCWTIFCCFWWATMLVPKNCQAT